MSETDAPDVVVCATYTFARRHPKVLGRIGGWAPPVQLSFVQLGTFAATITILVWSWGLWAPWLPPLARLLVVAGVPSVLCWAVRRSRVEGRSLVRAGLGFVTLACQPRGGTLAGRPAPSQRCVDWSRHRAWIQPQAGLVDGTEPAVAS